MRHAVVRGMRWSWNDRLQDLVGSATRLPSDVPHPGCWRWVAKGTSAVSCVAGFEVLWAFPPLEGAIAFDGGQNAGEPRNDRRMTTEGSAAGTPPQSAPAASVTAVSATAIGVGGMMGSGLYTLVGLATTTAGVWLPVAFLVGAFVAAFSVYSYAKLGAAFPSRGGAAQFLVEGFGEGVVAGGLNIFQFLGWVIAMALYASGFSGYALDLLPDGWPTWSGKLIALGLLLLVVAVNVVGTKLVGRSELYVIGVELAILLTFIVLGLTKSHFHRFEASGGSGFVGVLFAAGLLYVTFEGFGVVTNSAGSMRQPARQLPRAMRARRLSQILVDKGSIVAPSA